MTKTTMTDGLNITVINEKKIEKICGKLGM